MPGITPAVETVTRFGLTVRKSTSSARPRVVGVEQRLAHAHEDQVDPLRLVGGGPEHDPVLTHHLGRGQVTTRTETPGDAEGAGEGAACLRGQTQGGLPPAGHHNRLDRGAIREPEEELLAAVRRREHLQAGRVLQDESGAELAPKLHGQVRHFGKAGGSAVDDPGDELVDPKGPLEKRSQDLPQLIGRHADEVGHGRTSQLGLPRPGLPVAGEGRWRRTVDRETNLDLETRVAAAGRAEVW